MLFIKRRRPSRKPTAPVAVAEETPTTEYEVLVQEFFLHIKKYIGQTVTVFVEGGGVSGAGFTGALLDVNHEYLSLISKLGPPPACPLWNSCKRGAVLGVGSVVHIPIDKVASFVHNLLSTFPPNFL